MPTVLYSKIEGQNNPDKLLVIHGFLGMSDNWKSIAIQLAQDGFEVHSIDVRNHGRSFHSDEFNYDLLANDILYYCQTNNISKTNIIGHSMGGKIAMLFSALYPQLVNNLLIADIAPKSYPPHHQNILSGINAIDFSKITKRTEVDQILAQHINEVGTRQFLMKNLYRTTTTTFNFRFNRKVLTDNIEEIGQELNPKHHFLGNTLFLRGALSNYILDEDLINIKLQFPNASIDTVDKAGHWLHAENPTDFYIKTLEFLKK